MISQMLSPSFYMKASMDKSACAMQRVTGSTEGERRHAHSSISINPISSGDDVLKSERTETRQYLQKAEQLKEVEKMHLPELPNHSRW